MKLAATFAALLLSAQGAPPAAVKLWRLDCGRLDFADFAMFSDTGRYDGRARTLTDSCYLVKHGDTYLLWDTGLGADQDAPGFRARVTQRLVPQLARIGVKPSAIRYVGISHYHADHTGQAREFPAATLLIGAKDWAGVRANEGEARPVDGLAPWLTGGSRVDPVDGDRDVFGDGSVTMLSLPGHTPGHHALLVRLPRTGAVLLSGDQFHAVESMTADQVPAFNFDRADTLASSARFREIAANRHARIIIQHEVADVGKLPAFPAAAE